MRVSDNECKGRHGARVSVCEQNNNGAGHIGWTCKSVLLGTRSVGPAHCGEGASEVSGRCRSCMASQYT